MKVRKIHRSARALVLTGAFLFAFSCIDDSFDRAIQFEALPLEAFLPHDGYPVPGNAGIITTGVISRETIQLSWEHATDQETPWEELEYRVYRSTMNDIMTPDDAEANGIGVTAWETGMTTVIAAELEAGATYYFNVVVRDGDGLRTAYTTVSATTSGGVVYLFTAGKYNGDLAYQASSIASETEALPVVVPTRDTIDNLCVNARADNYSWLPCSNVRAFISVSDSDEIAGMPELHGIPANKRIIGSSGVEIAESWADLLDGSIAVTLKEAGIANDQWWSGSDNGGRYLADNSCGGWTDGTNSSTGMSGAHNRSNLEWIESAARNCNNQLDLLCSCW